MISIIIKKDPLLYSPQNEQTDKTSSKLGVKNAIESTSKGYANDNNHCFVVDFYDNTTL